MRNYSILLVDDDVHIRETVAKALQNEGYDVVTAANGKEALELIDQQKFDLILTDLVMEPIDGLGVLKRA